MLASAAAGPIRRMEMDSMFGKLWPEAFISLIVEFWYTPLVGAQRLLASCGFTHKSHSGGFRPDWMTLPIQAFPCFIRLVHAISIHFQAHALTGALPSNTTESPRGGSADITTAKGKRRYFTAEPLSRGLQQQKRIKGYLEWPPARVDLFVPKDRRECAINQTAMRD
ncbi:hypothetical protein S7711_10683 [Stachybotrys chartarum IBT 7711]|uniref:Uncharacterized protein n=1 Tax=Stachybotrys chartarum (strain CBS 109288 / IBT 7711) TaxID=1280523 RepID=A0A084AZJ7_STACB|nr:hypothetical protein S7711_10683 [Stachybotrys chartarum IBT 7711]